MEWDEMDLNHRPIAYKAIAHNLTELPSQCSSPLKASCASLCSLFPCFVINTESVRPTTPTALSSYVIATGILINVGRFKFFEFFVTVDAVGHF